MAKKKPHHNLPQSNPQQGQQRQLQRIARAEAFSGPLPPPQILEKYNEIVPDAANRIITMAENQAKHRHQLESEAIKSEIRNSRTGLHYGFIIGIAAILGGVVCTLAGYQIGGGIIGGTGITGLVGVFVYGSRSKRKEREMRFRKITEGE
jgi:uncharacterized membrane protein